MQSAAEQALRFRFKGRRMRVSHRYVRTGARRVWLHPFYVLVTFGSVLGVFVLVAAAWMMWQQRDLAVETARINLQNLSLAMAEQTDQVIELLGLAEDRLLDHLAVDRDTGAGETIGMTGSRQLHVMMGDIISGMPQAYALVLLDGSGNLVNVSNTFPVPTINFADRSYFRFAVSHPEVRSFISEAVISRQSQAPTFYVVRRLTGRDGTFKGVLMGAVQINYLMRLFSAITLPKGGSITLFRGDGATLVHYLAVANDGAARKDKIASAKRLTAATELPRHPLKILVSEPFDAAIDGWQIAAGWIGGIAGLGCLATAITLILAVRRFHDQQHLELAASALKVNEERKRAEREIAEQHARFGMALDNMGQGLLMFDRSNFLLLVNAAVFKIFALQPDALKPAMPLTDVVRVISGGENALEPSSDLAGFYMKLVRQNVSVKFLRALPDGRQLSVNFVPYGRGSVISFEDVTEVRKADERIAYMAMHDALTGLPNRAMLRTRIDEALAAVHRDGGFTVMCLDLDHFKDVNDTLGHPAGDRLLCEVAERILSVTRETDVVVRLGGDEFAIVARPGDAEADNAKLAARLVEAISAPYNLDGQMAFIGASIGIAAAPAHGADPDTLMKNADLALYQAKSNGRGCYAFFATPMEQHIVKRRRIEIELREALDHGEFELHYQPIVKVTNRSVIGFEALIRWRQATGVLVQPAEFIPIAENNGLITQIGEWALNSACREAAQWPGALKIAVNLSSMQFRSGKLADAVAAALEASGLAANRLELEITENTMMQDTDTTLGILKEIKALGVRIAMDDFGTGYSSLAYLQRFAFDKVKIDRAFVRDIDQSTNLVIIRAVTSIAENLGIDTTAEGVETEEQFGRIAEEGCHEAQGYLFSPPRPARDIPEMVTKLNSFIKSAVEPV